MVTDRFAVVHMPRTGGNALKHYLRDLMRDRVRWLDDLGHRRLRDVQDSLTVPIWGVIRNPWDWYASRFFARTFVVFPGADLGDTFAEHLRLGFDKPGFSWTEQLAHYFAATDGRCGLSRVLRFENLGNDVAAGLKELGIDPLPWDSVRRLRCFTPPGEHYTAELRDLVATRDAEAIAHWGYA